MPIYEYECQNCGRRSEALQKLDDPPLTTCEVCEGELKKLVSSPAFQFKGSGWYVTDYARKGGEGGSETKSAKAAEGEKASSSTEEKAPSPDTSGSVASGGSTD